LREHFFAFGDIYSEVKKDIVVYVQKVHEQVFIADILLEAFDRASVFEAVVGVAEEAVA